MEYFGYGVEDFIPCSICYQKAVDTHHIEGRGRRKDLENDLHNLIFLCRSCHEKYGDKKKYKSFLQDINKKLIDGKN